MTMQIADFRLRIADWGSPARRRRGVTILEVLFSILVTSVGLLGAIALFPVASARARRARVNDATAAAATNAVHMLDSMGMRRPYDRWYTWVTVGTPRFVGATPATLDLRQSYCIDTRFVVRNTLNWDTANIKTGLFPYVSPLNPLVNPNAPPPQYPRMLRIAYF